MKSFLAFTLLLSACTACHSTPTPPPPEPPIVVVDASAPADAADEPEDTTDAKKPATCATYCAHLAALGCAEGADARCVSVCNQIQASGYLSLDLACGLKATTPDQARNCGTSCRK